MNKPLGAIGAVAAGALAMYYLDPELGARRRALLADLLHKSLPGADRHHRGRPVRRPLLRPALPGDSHSDAEVRQRVQARLGRVASHPRAIQVHVDNGVVRLTGPVLAKEQEGLIEQLRQVPGVLKLVNALTAHDFPQEITGRPAVLGAAAASR